MPDLKLRVESIEHVGRVSMESKFIQYCKVTFKLSDCKFSQKQKERFLFLVGPRYNSKTDIVKFSVRQFTEYEYNYNKAVELIDETFLEALRAPQDEPVQE